MLKIKKISEMIGMRVFTDSGDFFGEVEEANLVENKIESWRLRVARDSNVSAYLGGAKGMIVPHQFVKSVGDVVIISKAAVPAASAEETSEELI
jgi:sporulation protein YlmC with PRC-barrel domain